LGNLEATVRCAQPDKRLVVIEIVFRSLYLVFTLLLFESAWAVNGGPQSVAPNDTRWKLPVKAANVKYVTKYHKNQIKKLRKRINTHQVALDVVGPLIRNPGSSPSWRQKWVLRPVIGNPKKPLNQEIHDQIRDAIVSNQQQLWKHEEYRDQIDITPASQYEKSAKDHNDHAAELQPAIDELYRWGNTHDKADLLAQYIDEIKTHRDEAERFQALANERKRLGFR